jgi:hypothetical protein
MALISVEELAWALNIPVSLAELALARVRARQLHEEPPPLVMPLPVIDDRRVRWADE